MFPLRELRFSLGEGSGHPNPNATVLDLPNQEKPMCAYYTSIIVLPKIKTQVKYYGVKIRQPRKFKLITECVVKCHTQIPKDIKD